MKKNILLLLALVPCIINAQLRTGTAILNIGSNTAVVVQGKVILTSDVAGNGSIILAGSNLQNIDAAGKKIPVLVINNAANINMLSNAILTDSLLFTKGKIFTDSNLLTLAPQGVVQGYASARFISTSDTLGNIFASGGFQLTVAANTGMLAPVGANVANYNPVTIKNISGPDEQYTIRVSPAAVRGAAAANTLNTTWSIAETTPGGNTISLKLQWNGASEPAGFNRSLATIVRSNGVTIAEKTGIIAAAGNNPYAITGGAFTGATLFGVTSDVNALTLALERTNADESRQGLENISMYPTVVSANIANLVIKDAPAKKYVYVITDMNGKTFVKQDITLAKGYNIIQLRLPNLASGLYMVNVYDGNILRKSIKFIRN